MRKTAKWLSVDYCRIVGLADGDGGGVKVALRVKFAAVTVMERLR